MSRELKLAEHHSISCWKERRTVFLSFFPSSCFNKRSWLLYSLTSGFFLLILLLSFLLKLHNAFLKVGVWTTNVLFGYKILFLIFIFAGCSKSSRTAVCGGVSLWLENWKSVKKREWWLCAFVTTTVQMMQYFSNLLFIYFPHSPKLFWNGNGNYYDCGCRYFSGFILQF